MALKNDTVDPFTRQLAEQWPVAAWKDVSLIVAISGGPDSMALFRGLNALRAAQQPGLGRFEAAHFNHGWRADQADQDEQFVSEVCEEFDVRLHIGRANTSKQTEEIARHERAAYLLQIAEQRGARYVAVAHTANDQAETILHRIIRGTGVKGLSGIPARRRLSQAVTLVRPMLWASRQDVLHYLKRLGQTYRLDSSNSDSRFTRNRIRNELLPKLAQDFNPNIVESLLRLGQLASEANQALQREIGPAIDACVQRFGGQTVDLDRDQLVAQPKFVQREILATVWRRQGWPEQSMGFDQWKRLMTAIARGEKLWFPGGIVIDHVDEVVRIKRTTP